MRRERLAQSRPEGIAGGLEEAAAHHLVGELHDRFVATTHPKAFTARYYAERLTAFSPPLGRAGMRPAEGLRIADRVVAPDLRDRLAVIARRR